MSVFGSQSAVFGSQKDTWKHLEVESPPKDSVSSLEFSPANSSETFLIAGSWSNDVRLWKINDSGVSIPKASQNLEGPTLDVCWSDDVSKVFVASVDRTAKMWDLNTDSLIQVAQHDAPIKTCHWIKTSNYTCLMTGSWDKTVKFWDTRQSTPMKTLQMPERVYSADAKHGMAIISCADRKIVCLKLENEPAQYKTIESPLRFQHRCVAIFKDKHQQNGEGFALGGIEGKVAIINLNSKNPRENFTFKAHRNEADVFAVNQMAFNPQHGTLATVGSDGKYHFWDKNARQKLKHGDQHDLPVSACAINSKGNLFAYSESYDWCQGHEFYNPQMKNKIHVRDVSVEMKAKQR